MAAIDSTNVPIPAQGSAEIDSVPLVSIRRLMWLRFRRNRLAIFGATFLSIMYLLAIFAGFVAPYGSRETHEEYASAPPHGLNFIDAQGNFHLVPFVYGYKPSVDPETFRKIYVDDTEKIYPLQFFVRGQEYTLFLGLITTDVHLIGVDPEAALFFLGTDTTGRDIFSRVLYGAQISLSVGLVGVLLALVAGTILGIATAFFGGLFDIIVQRLIEILMAFPTLPLWFALASIIPVTWTPDQVYFAISIVLSVLTWGGLARQVRGMVYALRETDFVTAARYANANDWRIITRHLLPNTMSHIIVIATLSIPGMILGETALSFLGLGIRAPMTSWGLQLSEAQHTRVLLSQPWLLTPAIFVVLTIISFNFLGDGIRDAADPFGK
jgi:peptide/nickel transport system permease protein